MRTTSSRHRSHGSLPPLPLSACACSSPESELSTRVCARRAPVAVDAASLYGTTPYRTPSQPSLFRSRPTRGRARAREEGAEDGADRARGELLLRQPCSGCVILRLAPSLAQHTSSFMWATWRGAPRRLCGHEHHPGSAGGSRGQSTAIERAKSGRTAAAGPRANAVERSAGRIAERARKESIVAADEGAGQDKVSGSHMGTP